MRFDRVLTGAGAMVPAVLLVVASLAPRAAYAAGDGATTPATAKQPTSGVVKAVAKKKKTPAKAARPAKASRTARSRPARAGVMTQAGLHTVNGDVKVTPFPSHAAAAAKALAQNRRDQLEDAEKAARARQQTDRWNTVLFHIRELDGRSDAEACFWRVVAYYRLGEMMRAKTIRQNCELGPREQATLDAEYSQAAGLQPASAMAEMLATGEPAPNPVENPDPYAGAGPPRVEP